jgi:hypothetical protein
MQSRYINLTNNKFFWIYFNNHYTFRNNLKLINVNSRNQDSFMIYYF